MKPLNQIARNIASPLSDLADKLNQLNRIIAAREKNFHEALSKSEHTSMLHHMKSDLDFLLEKRKELCNSVSLMSDRL